MNASIGGSTAHEKEHLTSMYPHCVCHSTEVFDFLTDVSYVKHFYADHFLIVPHRRCVINILKPREPRSCCRNPGSLQLMSQLNKGLQERSFIIIRLILTHVCPAYLGLSLSEHFPFSLDFVLVAHGNLFLWKKATG